jgi:hypothetical protein
MYREHKRESNRLKLKGETKMKTHTTYGTVRFYKKDVTYSKVSRWDIISLPGCGFNQNPDEPKLPRKVVFLAVPLGAKVNASDVTWEVNRLLTLKPNLNIIPVHEPTIGAQPDRSSIRKLKKEFQEASRKPYPLVKGRVYSRKAPFPEQPCRFVGTHIAGRMQLVAVEVCPIRYVPTTRETFLISNLSISVKYTVEKKRERRIINQVPWSSEHQYRAQLNHLKPVIVNKEIIPILPLIPPLPSDVPYVIITDNNRWNQDGTSGATVGDLIGEFSRLAAWKTAKGVRAWVFSLTDIRNGVYGEFWKDGWSRDTQEMIRDFLKWCYQQLGTQWVLLGGDVETVPVRRITHQGGGGDHARFYSVCNTADDPPDRRQFHIAAADLTFVKIHPNFSPANTERIIINQTGQHLEYVPGADENNPGWYYATDDTYTQESNAATEYVVARAPAAFFTGDYYSFTRVWNTNPTDLYYADLAGVNYGTPGIHDWDMLDNELYGQCGNGGQKDGVDGFPDVSVGRAPVSTVQEAAAFVDKVLGYEKFESPLSDEWVRSVVLAADYWGGPQTATRHTGALAALPEGGYYHQDGTNESFIHFKSGGAPDENELIAHVAEGFDVTIPYDTHAAADSLGYFFATDAIFQNASAVPTKFIVVRGHTGVLAPNRFWFESHQPERGMREKEQLKDDVFLVEFPELDLLNRYYKDYMDDDEYPAGDLHDLTPGLLETVLQTGPHFVSLTGHGWYTGCCHLNNAMAGGLTNTPRCFIAYADSCLTNGFDSEDAMSEDLVSNANGGAVGYVGNTRFSWIGAGDDYERRFWGARENHPELGKMNDMSKVPVINPNYLWIPYSLNLLGDPEMNIWSRVPLELDVSHPSSITAPADLTVTVHHDGAPVEGARVCITGPGRYSVGWTDYLGNAVFSFYNILPRNYLVTVTKPNYLPYQGSFRVERGFQPFCPPAPDLIECPPAPDLIMCPPAPYVQCPPAPDFDIPQCLPGPDPVPFEFEEWIVKQRESLIIQRLKENFLFWKEIPK